MVSWDGETGWYHVRLDDGDTVGRCSLTIQNPF